jgi:hypothetical protein
MVFIEVEFKILDDKGREEGGATSEEEESEEGAVKQENVRKPLTPDELGEGLRNNSFALGPEFRERLRTEILDATGSVWEINTSEAAPKGWNLFRTAALAATVKFTSKDVEPEEKDESEKQVDTLDAGIHLTEQETELIICKANSAAVAASRAVDYIRASGGMRVDQARAAGLAATTFMSNPVHRARQVVPKEERKSKSSKSVRHKPHKPSKRRQTTQSQNDDQGEDEGEASSMEKGTRRRSYVYGPEIRPILYPTERAKLRAEKERQQARADTRAARDKIQALKRRKESIANRSKQAARPPATPEKCRKRPGKHMPKTVAPVREIYGLGDGRRHRARSAARQQHNMQYKRPVWNKTNERPLSCTSSHGVYGGFDASLDASLDYHANKLNDAQRRSYQPQDSRQQTEQPSRNCPEEQAIPSRPASAPARRPPLRRRHRQNTLRPQSAAPGMWRSSLRSDPPAT